MSTGETMNTVTKAKDNWLKWFQARKSATIINKSNQEQLFKTFDCTVASDLAIATVMKHDEVTFLHKVNFGTKKVAIFHHLLETGGTLYDAGGKDYGFIQGVNDTTSTFLTPEVEVLGHVPSEAAVAIPTINHVLGAKSIEEVDNLTISATVTYHPRNFIPIPPFLLETVAKAIGEAKGDARVVLTQCSEAIKAFDSEHNSDEEFKDKAKQKCKDIVNWLYLVSKDSEAITAVSTIACSDPKLAKALHTIEDSKLGVTTTATPKATTIDLETSLKRPFEVLAATSSSTSEFMEKLTQLQSKSNEKSSKNFKKIPAKYQQMILVATSVGEVTEVEYTAEAVEFFKCSNTLHAQVMLNSLMETDGIECSISSAVATTLLYGSFLWRNPLSPAGLASSVLSTEGVLRTDTLHDGMVLDFSTKFDMSAASLSKLTKTQVLFPTDIEEMTHCFRGLKVLAPFFFREVGYMSQGLRQVVNFCLDNRMLLRARFHMDPSFIAKIMCAVDERIYHWLKQCSIYTMVLDTETYLMDFTSLLMDIRLNRFVYILPPSIAKLVSKDATSDTKPVDKERKDRATAIRNSAPVQEWKLRPQETWNTVFRNQTFKGPMLSMQCHPCLKYHVRGACFSDCKNKASHLTLTGDDKTSVTKFIQSLRGE